eukprot:TRINITY_DN51072_c0_g1_i1.p1 TRINITY_DN51072_c0_g1~~TRINITY_DN51072_c0_g1_i1.p1  ORF type:complete len:1334 (-),score=231.92 TRINITY_DN51072_c0_g1_i1:255-4256(-)
MTTSCFIEPGVSSHGFSITADNALSTPRFVKRLHARPLRRLPSQSQQQRGIRHNGGAWPVVLGTTVYAVVQLRPIKSRDSGRRGKKSNGMANKATSFPLRAAARCKVRMCAAPQDEESTTKTSSKGIRLVNTTDDDISVGVLADDLSSWRRPSLVTVPARCHIDVQALGKHVQIAVKGPSEAWSLRVREGACVSLQLAAAAAVADDVARAQQTDQGIASPKRLGPGWLRFRLPRNRHSVTAVLGYVTPQSPDDAEGEPTSASPGQVATVQDAAERDGLHGLSDSLYDVWETISAGLQNFGASPPKASPAQAVDVSAATPIVTSDMARIKNSTSSAITVFVFYGAALSYLEDLVLTIPPMAFQDISIEKGRAKVALRRVGDARLFTLEQGLTVEFQRADIEDGPTETNVYRVNDILGSITGRTGKLANMPSWEVLPGPLFWRLPRNAKDQEFEVGSVFETPAGVRFKVVRSVLYDWRGYPRARIRVVRGALQAGKFFSNGQMFFAKIMPSKQAVEETKQAYKKVSSPIFGVPSRLGQVETSLQTTDGANLLIYEDWGMFLSEFLKTDERVSAKDADQCIMDLLEGLASLHAKEVYHLALSPNTVRVQRDALGTLRLKIANLGVAEQPSEPLPSDYVPSKIFAAPEVETVKRLTSLTTAYLSKERKGKAHDSTPSGLLAKLEKELAEIPRKSGALPAWPLQKVNMSQFECVKSLLSELDLFAELPADELARLARGFQGPYKVPKGQVLFKEGEPGDFLYFVLSGEVVATRRLRTLAKYTRGDFLGEAALLDRRPSDRFFSAQTPRDGNGCIVLRMPFVQVKNNLATNRSLTQFIAPSRWRYLAKDKLPWHGPRAADVFSAGLIWCRLVAKGARSEGDSLLARVRSAETIEGLRAAVTSPALGQFYFTLEERRVVALIELLIRRTPAAEALQCLEGAEEPDEQRVATEPGDAGEHGAGHQEGASSDDQEEDSNTKAMPFEFLQRFRRWDFDAAPRRQLAEKSTEIVGASMRSRASVVDTFGRAVNVWNYQYGRFCGKILGDVYGRLFGKDLFWIFRSPTRVARYPILLVRDAERGSLTARYTIAVQMAFEKALREKTLPNILPQVAPGFQAGFQIGAAAGRNRAVNWKTLWWDAWFVSFSKQLRAQLRIRWAKLGGRWPRWNDLQRALQDATVRGSVARARRLAVYGRLPEGWDRNSPEALKMLPEKWVPDIGLPFADGIAGGFFKRLPKGFKKTWRRKCVIPKFETWDVDDLPKALLDFAREQGEGQAELVAGALGGSMSRDLGWFVGTCVGTVNGLVLVSLGKKPIVNSAGVADGKLVDDQELYALEAYRSKEE